MDANGRIGFDCGDAQAASQTLVPSASAMLRATGVGSPHVLAAQPRNAGMAGFVDNGVDVIAVDFGNRPVGPTVAQGVLDRRRLTVAIKRVFQTSIRAVSRQRRVFGRAWRSTTSERRMRRWLSGVGGLAGLAAVLLGSPRCDDVDPHRPLTVDLASQHPGGCRRQRLADLWVAGDFLAGGIERPQDQLGPVAVGPSEIAWPSTSRRTAG